MERRVTVFFAATLAATFVLSASALPYTAFHERLPEPSNRNYLTHPNAIDAYESESGEESTEFVTKLKPNVDSASKVIDAKSEIPGNSSKSEITTESTENLSTRPDLKALPEVTTIQILQRSSSPSLPPFSPEVWNPYEGLRPPLSILEQFRHNLGI